MFFVLFITNIIYQTCVVKETRIRILIIFYDIQYFQTNWNLLIIENRGNAFLANLGCLLDIIL
jgi:hypothetical protein